MTVPAIDPRGCLRSYLAPSDGAAWRWSDDRTALERGDGVTIAFLAEVRELIEWFAAHDRGLPPWGSVLWLLQLARPEWRAQEPAVAAVPAAVLDALRLHSPLRCELIAEALREEARTTREFAAGVAAALREPQADELLRPRRIAVAESVAKTRIAARLAAADLQQLMLRARSGLDEEPAAADIALPEAAPATDLLAQMRGEPELAGLAALVRDLTAAIRVPRLQALPAQLRLGGTAGLVNRGELDRLTIGELAQDDEVLAVRVATNEALYLQREVPPTDTGLQRCVLLDAGLRLWGRARVFAIAVALALRQLAGPRVPVRVFAANGTAVEEVDLGSRAGLFARLSARAAQLDVGAALPAFAAACARIDARREAIVVTHRDAVADPEFRARCVPTPDAPQFVASVDDRGAFALWSVSVRGWKQVAAAQLDLATIAPRTAKRQAGVAPAQTLALIVAGQARRDVMRRPVTGVGVKGQMLCLRFSQRHFTFVAGGTGVYLQREHTKVVCAALTAVPGATDHRRGARLANGCHVQSSRGLLYLRTERSDLELTIVLVHNGPIAACSSDGRFYGNRRYLPSGCAVEPNELLVALLHRFVGEDGA